MHPSEWKNSLCVGKPVELDFVQLEVLRSSTEDVEGNELEDRDAESYSVLS